MFNIFSRCAAGGKYRNLITEEHKSFFLFCGNVAACSILLHSYFFTHSFTQYFFRSIAQLLLAAFSTYDTVFLCLIA